MIDGRKRNEFVLGAGRVFGDQTAPEFVFIGFGGYGHLNVGFTVGVPFFLPFDVTIKKISYTSLFANAFEHSFAIYTHLAFPIIQLPTEILRTGVFQNVIVDDLDVPVAENEGLVFGIFKAAGAGGGLFSGYCDVLLERDFG